MAPKKNNNCFDKLNCARRSTRDFKDYVLSDAEILSILDAARRAPSPKNRQPWHFVILRKNDIKGFFELCMYKNRQQTDNPLKEHNTVESTLRIVAKADTIILVFNTCPSEKVFGSRVDDFDLSNVQAIGAAIQNMLLKATELEISSLWICDILYFSNDINNRYYPSGKIIAAVALGKESYNRSPISKRKSLPEIVSFANSVQTQSPLIWVGPRESDVANCQRLFLFSVTIFGSNKNNNYSWLSKSRVNHNGGDIIPDAFWDEKIDDILRKNPSLKILYYDGRNSYHLRESLKSSVIGANERVLLELLSDKITMRNRFFSTIPVVPFQEVSYCKNIDLFHFFPNSTRIVCQEPVSSGGFGTRILRKNDTASDYFDEGTRLLVSPYISPNVPINIHICCSMTESIVFPGSIQIVKEIDGKVQYIGSDYIAYKELSATTRHLIHKIALQISEYIRSIGYRGIAGIDFLLSNGNVYFVELNARFQASSVVLNCALTNNNLPSLHELHIQGFQGDFSIKQDKLDKLDVHYSMVAYTPETIPWNPYRLRSCKYTVAWQNDGWKDSLTVEDGAYLFRVIFNTNCSSISPNGTIETYENLFRSSKAFRKRIYEKDILAIKISLLNQGVRFSQAAKEYLAQKGIVRAAVFNAVDITILNNLHINCPMDLKFGECTPWIIDYSENEIVGLTLLYEDSYISDVAVDLEDPYCRNKTLSGIEYSSICFWATDRIRVHHTLSCTFKDKGIGCQFCEIQPCSKTIVLSDIQEVIDFYLTNANTFRHFLIGGGSETRKNESVTILQIVKHIRKRSDKNIYVMSVPPENTSVLYDYYASGVSEIGFNIEIFDEQIARKYMPGKGQIKRSEYYDSLEAAVLIWGRNGKVRSLVIVGLESDTSLISGINKLASMGVMPILSVFRPIPGTPMQDKVPPSNEYLYQLYETCEDICIKYSLHLGPDCPYCQNNTLSLPFENKIN